MLKSLYIKNFAIIDELNINFEKGLNILTGETGAGKSIMIDAIGLAFGDRAVKEQIKTGETKAVIELEISVSSSFSENILEENGIELEDGKLFITREITENATRSRVNGVMVTQSYVKQLREQLIDIHSQHETYTYINPSTHITLLDNYGNNSHRELLKEFSNLYNKYNNTKKELERIKISNENAEQQKDFLEFQIKEIEEAQIFDVNEDMELENRRKVLLNAQELKDLTYSSYYQLYGIDNSIIDMLNNIENSLIKAAQYDENISDFTENISSNAISLRELSDGLRSYSQSLEIDPEVLNEVEERIMELDKIKRKHGNSLETALANLNAFKEELNEITTSTDKIEHLAKELGELTIEIEKAGKIISDSRTTLAEKLSALIQNELQKLEMPKVRFYISIEQRQEFTEKGFDNVEFLISTNIGEPLKPLAKIASGGEVSRVMLAIKTIFAKADMIETVIFDEIDTGISGKTSQAVAEEIANLSSSHQVLCITHQPIIAAMADVHFHVSKKEQDGKTIANVDKLNGDSVKTMLARMASGLDDINSINFASQLIEKAEDYKNNFREKSL